MSITQRFITTLLIHAFACLGLVVGQAMAEGSIEGRVVDAVDGAPAPGARIVAYDKGGSSEWPTSTDSEGRYRLDGLAAGEYVVYLPGEGGYAGETYPDKPCPWWIGAPRGCRHRPVQVVEGQVTASIDFSRKLGARVSGRLTDAVTGEPISSGGVLLLVGITQVGAGFTDADGNYEATSIDSSGLPTGPLHVVGLAGGYVPEVHGGRHCSEQDFLDVPFCHQPAAIAVELVAGQTTSGIDIALDVGGAIEATLEVANGGSGDFIAVLEDASGLGVRYEPVGNAFRLSDLGPGDYRLGIIREDENFPYLDEFWPDLHCPELRCDRAAAGLITVEPGQTASDIHVVIDRAGEIRGRLTSSQTGEPIVGAEVWPMNGAAEFVGLRPILTDANGFYSVFDAAAAPPVYLAIQPQDSVHASALYGGGVCVEGFDNCDVAALGLPVEVAPNGVLEIDLMAPPGAVISGRITVESDGQPLEDGAAVAVLTPGGRIVAEGQLGDEGRYTTALRSTNGLPAGSYWIQARPQGYQRQLFDAVDCPWQDISRCDLQASQAVTVEAGEHRQGIDFAVVKAGSVSGRVLHDGGSVGVYQGLVAARRGDGRIITSVLSDEDGNYLLDHLPAGEVYITAEGGDHHSFLSGAVYPGVRCLNADCDLTAGTPLSIVVGERIEGIDFVVPDLLPCEAEDELCLMDDRFQVEVAWTDFEGRTGVATADSLTRDAGTFWFFDGGNVEIMVKVLDGCNEPRERFWVFAAGLTNLATEITVYDRWSHQSKTYTTDLGEAFGPILDTDAFDTCYVGQRSHRSVSGPTALVDGLGVADSSATTGDTVGPCFGDDTTLCLGDGRFRIEALWASHQGDSGRGHAVPLSSNTGTFWFFDEANVEVIVKVLDACAEPFDRFWVFAAGLTNIEVTLQVTDLESGQSQIYHNPLGMAFQPVQDTNAFATCP